MSDSNTQVENEAIARAKLGADAEVFIKSNLGRHLLGQADAQKKILVNDLIEADPADAKINTEIRNDLHVIHMFKKFLNDTINIGRSAIQQIEQLDAQAEEL